MSPGLIARKLINTSMTPPTQQNISILARLTSVRVLAGTVGACFGMIAAAWAIDDHYNQSPEIASLTNIIELTKNDYNTKINGVANEVKQMRIDTLEDRLFFLQSKGRPSPIDKAMIQRYQLRLKSIRNQQPYK